MSNKTPEPALSYERIREARETLTAAFSYVIGNGNLAAIQQTDPAGVFAEAKRNLTALLVPIHGQRAWRRMLKEDETR